MGYIAKGSITLDTVNDAYTVSLSKQSCVIHADFDGSNPQLSEAQTTVTVLRGDKVMAFDCAPVVDNGSNINFTIENTNRTSYRIVLTSIPTNSLEGTLQFRITTDDGYATTIQFSYTVVRESTMLDWIQDWEGGKTKIGGTYIMTPKIFIGKKDEYAEYGEGGTNAKDSIMSVPGLTGVYIGPDTESTGVYGYLNSEEIFHLNGTGGMIGGWVIDSYGIRSKNGNLQILSNGEIRAINDEGDSIWRITEGGEASFAMENVRFFANGDAEFTGKITSKEGQIGGWTIEEGCLYNTPIGISASGKYIAIANVQSIPTGSEWGDNHFGWMRGYGGAALYYSSSNNFGFIAYGPGGDNMVFHAGSTNYIAGWKFDNEAIWSGTKNNTTSGYSTDGITIGSTGLRGIKWYIDSSGDVSFMGGKITFSAADNGGEIVGWKLNERRLSTDKVALTSDDTSVGLYMSAATNAKFNTFASSSLEDFIDSWGGIYMKVKPDSADFAAYNSEGTRLFKIKSGGVSYIAGWRFDAETLYTGEAVTSGYTSSGQITLGPTGLRGYKWRFENDGSGAVAGGNISWDSNGNVTFGSSVSLNWQSGIDAAQESASVAQMIAFGQMLYRDPEFTKDKKNGTAIYAYGSFDYCTFSASQLAIAMRDYGLLLKGNACVTRVDLIHSDGTITTVFTGSVQTNAETTTDLCGPIINTVESDTVRISYTGEDAWLKAEAYDDDSISLGWLNLCGFDSILGKQYINTSRALVPDATAPNSTQQVVQFTNTRWVTNSDFRLGGFLFANKSRANGKFVVKIVAKIPVGWKIENYHNSYGNGAKTKWVTSQNGTGEYTEYICVVTCGATGTFSTINHFALKCGDGFTGVAGEDEFATGIKREKESAGDFAESVVWCVAYATVFDATSSDKVTTTIDAHGIYTGTLRADQIIAGTIDATKISADVILSNGNAWALNKDGSGYLANKNISWDKDGNTSFNGKIKATSGEIGQFSINNQGLYYGDISKWTEAGETNMSQIGPNFVRMEQAVGYFQAGDIAYQKIGIGAGSDPTQSFESDKYCGSALYIYRKMNSISDWYFPAAQIISDNVINRNIGLRIVGGLQVHGGIIEKGHVVTLTDSGGASSLDLSFGTTFLLINSASSSRDFFFPTLSNLRQQLGITDTTESFCVPITIICGSSSNNCAISAASAASNSPGKEEGGSIVNNNGKWDYQNSDSYGANRMALSKGDCWIFALVFTPSTGYYIQIISIHV